MAAVTGEKVTYLESHQNLVAPRPDPVIRRPAAKAAFLLKHDDVLQIRFRGYCQRAQER
jgi:hypothetical protein